ncbi:MAG: sugar phosphate isomerase/epimerase [Lentisphaeria bacterium]|nr:sugar phosphate isomerase/epimerase [Lentisphaeria bacterium]
MITYALTAPSPFGKYISESVAAAMRKSKFRNFELTFSQYIKDDEQSRTAARLTRQLIDEGIIHPVSVHLPFTGGGISWDPSTLDEDLRKDVSARQIRMIRDHVDQMAPMVTIHASGEGIPMSEHPQRIGQMCKTIEEMLPIAGELGFVINVEFLPRTCLGNCVEELRQIVSNFDPNQVGVCLDVNHIMNRYRELPAMIDTLAPRIRSFHISDYDGVDETHWLPGQGIHDWPELMRHIRAIDHDVLLILETTCQLTHSRREIDSIFALRQNERACWFLENCDRLMPEIEQFRIPGN